MITSRWMVLFSAFALLTPIRMSQADAPAAADADALPVAVSPTDARLQYIGRWDTSDPAGPRGAWPAVSVRFRFRGTAANVVFSDTNKDDRYSVVVDSQPPSVLVARQGSHVYSLYAGQAFGPHTVVITKRTESYCGTGQITGFQLALRGRLLALPALPHRGIEIIGDSISCGYGDEAAAKEEHFSPDTENADAAYGAVLSRIFGAQYACIAWSGRKMWPNNTMPEIYDRALPLDDKNRWDFARWTPDVVIINLSTNDFGSGTPDRAGWTAAYEAFLAHVRQNYPKAAIYCATSPMMWGDTGAVAKGYLTQIVTDENTAGDKNVRLLSLSTQDGSLGYGADWHPNLKNQARTAQEAAAALQSDLGWKPQAGLPGR